MQSKVTWQRARGTRSPTCSGRTFHSRNTLTLAAMMLKMTCCEASTLCQLCLACRYIVRSPCGRLCPSSALTAGRLRQLPASCCLCRTSAQAATVKMPADVPAQNRRGFHTGSELGLPDLTSNKPGGCSLLHMAACIQ